ncbi:hypothetical protein XANCAGTX0491_005055 [Xanthoria calcicola]
MEDNPYRPHLVASTEGSDPGPSGIEESHPAPTNGPEHPSPGSTHFKCAQWSPDGTTILTSTADHVLKTYILPSELLSAESPIHLLPYASHASPEPVYATSLHPSYTLQDPASTLYLASPRSLPIRLLSPFSRSILASYPLVSKTTEEYISPHSLLFSIHAPHTFFAGSLNLISSFDINRNGEGPVERMPTVPSKRSKVVGGIGGIKGIVSALGMSSEGILAAGTFSRWVGLYDAYGRGGSLGAFQLQADRSSQEAGTGITQVLWSVDGRYLCVAERCSDGVGVWDVRGTGKELAWMRGRNAETNQRMGVEMVGNELWAGGLDGRVRVWHGLGEKEGIIDPTWEFEAHTDAVSCATWHYSGTVLATCSGQRHSDDDVERSTEDLGHSAPHSRARQADNSLKIWGVE